MVDSTCTPTGIGRFDYASGALIAEQDFTGFPASFFSHRLTEVGPDRLAVLVSPEAGLLVVDKASIQ